MVDVFKRERLLTCPSCERTLPVSEQYWDFYWLLLNDAPEFNHTLCVCKQCSLRDYDMVYDKIKNKPWIPLVFHYGEYDRLIHGSLMLFPKPYYTITDYTFPFETGWNPCN